MAVDLAKVRVRPRELVDAAGRVLEAGGPAPSAPPAVASAARRTVGSFVEWAARVLEGRDLELRDVVRREVPEAEPGSVRRAVEAVRLEDEGAVEAAVPRLERELTFAFAARDEARVRQVLETERDSLLEVDDRADVRAVRAAEVELAWEGRAMRPLP